MRNVYIFKSRTPVKCIVGNTFYVFLGDNASFATNHKLLSYDGNNTVPFASVHLIPRSNREFVKRTATVKSTRIYNGYSRRNGYRRYSRAILKSPCADFGYCFTVVSLGNGNTCGFSVIVCYSITAVFVNRKFHPVFIRFFPFVLNHVIGIRIRRNNSICTAVFLCRNIYYLIAFLRRYSAVIFFFFVKAPFRLIVNGSFILFFNRSFILIG